MRETLQGGEPVSVYLSAIMIGLLHSGVTCVDCQMPPAGKGAETFGRYVDDVKSHIVKISTNPADKMFTDDGKFATGILTVDFACLRCHGARDMEWALATAKRVHTRGK